MTWMLRIESTRRKFVLLAVTLAVLGILLADDARSVDAATTFTVNKTGDAPDIKLTDNVCDSSPKKGRQCTLRAAIEQANFTPGTDTINFKIGGTTPVKTISPTSELPPITEALSIDGYSQSKAKANTLSQGNDVVLKIQLSGTNAGNFSNGLTINTSNTTIRGLVINRFGGSGISVEGSASTNNKVKGNFLGTDPSGTQDLGNGGNGVNIQEGTANIIGGTEPADRNLISGNDSFGVHLFVASSASVVEGNFIGTTKGGVSTLGNSGDGVFTGAANNTIGGTVSGAGNVISGNKAHGVAINMPSSTNNKVEGNRIGTDPSGTTHVGNTLAGVWVSAGASNNTIGGTVSEAGNTIAGNKGSGIELLSSPSGNKVEGNEIRDNGSDGVTISGSNSNTIGGATSAAGNRISDNASAGVNVVSGTANRILSNLIFSNSGLGIDLGTNGVTANDTDDPDPGPNNLQNFPDISSVTSAASTTTISGTLNSNPTQNFTIQCYLTETGGDSSGHGEGQILLGSTTAATDASGDATFACVVPLQTAGEVSATAINTTSGDTSEFSRNVAVTSGT